MLRRSTRQSSGASPIPDTGLAALGCLVSLLVGRLAWLHYYTLAIVPILYLLRPNERAEISFARAGHHVRRALALAASLLVAANSGRLPAALRPDAATLALTTNCGALLLLWLVFIDFHGARHPFPRKHHSN